MYQPPGTKIIQLTQGKSCIVCGHRYNALMKFKWRAVRAHRSWYAKAWFMTPSGRVTITMHRFILQTPFGMIGHHKDGNTMNNTDSNLENQTKKIHQLHHQHNKILVQFENYM